MAKPTARIQQGGASTELKRYTLTLPTSLYNEVQTVAKEQHASVLEILRRFVVMGLMIVKASREPDTSFIIRQGDREREILFT